jgi:hypothetical protein
MRAQSWDCRKFWGLRARRALSGLSLTWGVSVAWILRRVKSGTEGGGRSRDVMGIERPDDIAYLGLTLSETKRLFATLQQEIAAAQVRDHRFAGRPAHAAAGVAGQRIIRTMSWPRFSVRSRCGFPAFAVQHVAGASLASTGHRIADRHRNWIGYRRISPPS